MVGLVIAAIFLVFGVAFKSVVVPLRAALTVVWMLTLTLGAASLIYSNPSIPGGTLFWMSPCIAFAVVVGLGLDYDVFFMESVMEHVVESNMSVSAAVVVALEQTGNSIAAAGIIMVIAFAALVLSASPVLYELGFLLAFGVVIDCFVTTKVVIPCLMALLPERLNFWPLTLPEVQEPKAEAKPEPAKADIVLEASCGMEPPRCPAQTPPQVAVSSSDLQMTDNV